MDAARQAIHKITGRTGHTTDVDEVVNPAITRETVKPSRHEETTEAIDREVHQHHYHTTVQPVTHSETLPERHTHNLLPTQEKEYQHGDHAAVKAKVTSELGAFADSSTVSPTRQTASVAPAIAGEHVHHHVHETVQPIIHKETHQPEVVHTTIPIHEVHQAEAQHHGISALPMKTLSEFKHAGGILTGNQTHAHEEYDGPPRPYNKDLQTTTDKVLNAVGIHGHNTTSGHSNTSSTNTSPTHAKTDSGVGVAENRSTIADKLNPTHNERNTTTGTAI